VGRGDRLETRSLRIVCGDESAEVLLEGEQALVRDHRVRFRALTLGGEIRGMEIDGRRVPLRMVLQGEHVLLWCEGRVFELQRAAQTRPRETGGELVSPMPGRVRRVLVAEGEPIERGKVVLILEAMKMEHAIRAPRDGVIASIAYGEGDLVEAGVKLAEIR
jgi:acetyl/propionyl-CoA carboxylase alpha subunit